MVKVLTVLTCRPTLVCGVKAPSGATSTARDKNRWVSFATAAAVRVSGLHVIDWPRYLAIPQIMGPKIGNTGAKGL